MLPFNLGWVELSIILVIVVVIFGAGKLPEIGSSLGKSIRGFKTEIAEANKDIDGKAATEAKATGSTAATAADLPADARPATPAPPAAKDEAVR
ncbi:MAG: twin-arginine translocase TatA/TatE family subunit [Chloroflexi bacterium]|nr:twin-arginine translocase TatA/TatE family subunit [Chloroflexota bacterium]